jgi:hypothetical protein
LIPQPVFGIEMKKTLVIAGLCAATLTLHGQRQAFTVVEATIPEMRTALEQHRVTSVEIVTQYLTRIGTYEDKLHAAPD